MNEKTYVSLGASDHRKETSADQLVLRCLINQCWENIRDFPYRSYYEIKDWQLARIKAIVKHAYETVPLYADKYRGVGFLPGDLKTWEDFNQLPFLTKEELIDGFSNRTVSSKHTTEFTTRSSGSSGRFVTLAVSPEAIYIDTIQGARQFYFQSGKNYFEKDLAVFVGEIPWWVESIDGKYPTVCVELTQKPQDIITQIAQKRPKVLSLYSSMLNKLVSCGFRPNKCGIELIVVHSEQSEFARRKELSDMFDVPVLDEFSSEELTRIALECPNRQYHIEEDACYLEIVDPSTKKLLEPGKRGIVVGTNLLNTATPVIRYLQGDIASIKESQHCSCGSNFRIIGGPEGRYMDSLVLPNGELLPSGCVMGQAYFWYIKLKVPVHGLQYQIVQNETGNLDIYLISGAYRVTPEKEKEIKSLMREIIPEEMRIDIHRVKQLPFIGGKKFRPILSLKSRTNPFSQSK